MQSLTAANFCSTGQGAVQIVTADNLEIQSDKSISGAQFIVSGLTNISSKATTSAMAIEAGGDVFLQSDNALAGCARNEHVWFGATSGPKLSLVK